MNENQQQNSPMVEQTRSGAVKKPLSADVLKWIIIGLLAVVIITFVLGIGIFVGERKAGFSYRWAEQYHRNFAGPQAGFFSDWRSFPRGDFIEGHGIFGEIIELNDSGFVIRGRDNVEKVVVTTENTIINRGRETIKDELKVGDWVVIIGSPNEQGQIEARLIRLFNEQGNFNKPL